MSESAIPPKSWEPSPDELLQKAAYQYLKAHKLTAQRAHSGNRPSFWLGTIKAIFVSIAWLHGLYFGTVACVCAVFVFVNPGVSSLMVQRAIQGTKVKAVRFIPSNQLSAGMRSVFIELEDHDFYSHHGISLGAIKDAVLLNRQLGRTVSGGSTITQQLAKNLFLNPDKNFLRKYLEAGTALIMEGILGKKRIMELYLNYIEFGPGIFGLGRGALYQHKASYSDLDWDQRVRLAVIITNPIRYNVNNFYKNRGMWARYQAIVGFATTDE